MSDTSKWKFQSPGEGAFLTLHLLLKTELNNIQIVPELCANGTPLGTSEQSRTSEPIQFTWTKRRTKRILPTDQSQAQGVIF